MIETSSDLLRSSSAIFGNLRKISGNVGKHSSGLRGKVVGNLRKIVTFYIIKKKLHGCAEIRNLSSCVEKYFNTRR